MADAQPQSIRPSTAEASRERQLQSERRFATSSPPLPDLSAPPANDNAPQRTEEQRFSALHRERFADRQRGEQMKESPTNRAKNALRGLRSQNAAQGRNAGISMKDAMKLAKNPTPTGIAMQLAMNGGGSGPGGMPMNADQAKRMIGNALIKSSWSNLWMTFGHSVYILCILFFAGWASKYLRQYIPEVGREWFPGEMGNKVPAHVLLPLKLGEIVALAFILFWVVLIDIAFIATIGFVVGLIFTVSDAASSLNPF